MSVTSILFLILSLLLNGVLVWYIIKLIQEMRYISENVEYTSGVLNNFSEHLEKLYELETYYGDENLKSLIRHSRQVLEEVKEFETVISSIDKEIIDDETEEED
jgi:predicted PurR-regulated permease PerM